MGKKIAERPLFSSLIKGLKFKQSSERELNGPSTLDVTNKSGEHHQVFVSFILFITE